MENKSEAFDQFAILEIVGHRRLGGRVREATIGGIPLIRIDAFRDGAGPVTQYYGPSAIFCLTPATEEAARMAGRFEAPVSYEVDVRATSALGPVLKQAIAALRDAEWKGTRDVTGRPCCPVCKALEDNKTHAGGCAIGAALAADDDIPF